MRRSWAAITVGLLALVGLVISGAIFAITTKRGGAGKSIVVYALFHDARGIADKTRVLSAGLKVGEVIDKTLDPVKKPVRKERKITVHAPAISRRGSRATSTRVCPLVFARKHGGRSDSCPG